MLFLYGCIPTNNLHKYICIGSVIEKYPAIIQDVHTSAVYIQWPGWSRARESYFSGDKRLTIVVYLLRYRMSGLIVNIILCIIYVSGMTYGPRHCASYVGCSYLLTILTHNLLPLNYNRVEFWIDNFFDYERNEKCGHRTRVLQ